MTGTVIALSSGTAGTPNAHNNTSTAPATSWAAGGNLPFNSNGTGAGWNSIAYSPSLGMFVACNNVVGNNNNTIAYSTNAGTSWTGVTAANIDGGSASWTISAICWSPSLGMFCAVSGAGPTTTKRILTSTNGTTWTAQVLPDASIVLNDVCWSKDLSLFVAVGNTNAIYHSADGVTWTKATGLPGTSQSWTGCCWAGNGSGGGPQIFVICSSSAGTTNNFAWSADGITWTQVSGGGTRTPAKIAYSPALGYIAGIGGNTGFVIYSNTPKTSWSQINSGIGSTNFTGICWSPDLAIFVAVGNTTSALTSTNGTTWTLSGAIMSASYPFNSVAGTDTSAPNGTVSMAFAKPAIAVSGYHGVTGTITMSMGNRLAFSIPGDAEGGGVTMHFPKPSFSVAGYSGVYGSVGLHMAGPKFTVLGKALGAPGNLSYYSWWFLGS